MNRIFFAIICAGFFVMGCGFHESEILKCISDASKQGTIIDLRLVADGNWDRLLVFRPYTPKKTIENKIGSPWSGAHKIEMRDDGCLLVFVKENDVVASGMVPLNLADFHLADFHEIPEIPREQAVFEFTGSRNRLSGMPDIRHAWQSR
jgi:hypothetical protein